MKGKHFAKANWSRTRIVSAILSVALLFGCITFTTAWLIAENEEGPVVNKFTGSKLEIELTPDGTAGTYKLIPGITYDLSEKETPAVTVFGGSVECYLFVVYEETNDKYYSSFLSGKNASWDYQVIGYNNHTLPAKDGVATCVLVPKVSDSLPLGVIESKDVDQSFEVIHRIDIKSDVTKNIVHPNYFKSNGGNEELPKITATAYAIQTLGFRGKNGSDVNDVKAAWAVVEEAIRRNNTKEVVLN